MSNTEAWTSTFPSGMKFHDGERGSVAKLGGIPPIRLIPVCENTEEASFEKATVTIKFTDKAKDTYTKFTGGSPEQAVRHVKLFYSIASKMDLKESHKTFSQLVSDNRGLINDLGKLDENSPSDQIQQKKTLLAENDAAKTSMATIMKEYWTLFERLLGSELVDAWQQIVQTETETIGYVAQDGTRVTGRVRGKRFDSMKWCVRTWLLKVVKPNAAERHRTYMTSQIVWPSSKVEIGPFVDRISEMNSYNKYLPSLKDEEGSPPELVRSNEPFSQLEMCNIILTALPFNFASSFWAAKGAKHFPVCVKTLKADLQLIEPAYSVTAKLAAQVKLNAKSAPGTAPEKGKDYKKRKLTDPIPRKTKVQKTHGREDTARPDKNQKICQYCSQWSKSSMHTHATKDCRKWHPDGTSKYSRKSKSANRHALDSSDMQACFAQMRKENKKMLKKLSSKKKSRKQKKKKVYYSSSDSSDDSDSE